MMLSAKKKLFQNLTISWQIWANCLIIWNATVCFKILPFSRLCLDVLLHPWPKISAKTKLQIFPVSQEKKSERTATLANLEGQNNWIQYCDPNGYLNLPKPTAKAFQIHILTLQGGVDSITLGLFFSYVWILTLNIWKTAQHNQKGPVKLKNCKKSLFGRSWSIRAALYTLSKLCKTTWVSDNYH